MWPLVNAERCDGSGECVKVCCYEDAITLQTVVVNGREQKRAVVTPANCVGCGVCVSACPNRAIDLQGWTLDQYDAMVDAITADDIACNGVCLMSNKREDAKKRAIFLKRLREQHKETVADAQALLKAQKATPP